MKRKLPSTIIGDAAKEIRIRFGLSQASERLAKVWRADLRSKGRNEEIA